MKENFDLRVAAYGFDGTHDILVLCRNIELMGGGTIVHTQVPGLQQQLDQACPEAHAQIVESQPDAAR